MKIGIITIATNNYKSFLHPLISSIHTYFVPESEKHYFLFTDEKLDWFDQYNHTWTKIQHEPWPYITLKRFEIISKMSDQFADYDYVIYFDSDMEFISQVNSFDLKDRKYISVCHPSSYYNDKFWPVEKNPNSTAYIPTRNDYIYMQGCLWGARGIYINNIIHTLRDNINEDLKNDIIAVWHDESHLNKFFSEHKNEMAILHSGFAYPETWNLTVPCFVIHKDKNMIEYPRFSGKHKPIELTDNHETDHIESVNI